MRNRPSAAFWIELVLALASGFMFLLTLVWRDWLEGGFGWNPDDHNGSLEWLLVAVLLAVALIFSVMARSEWRRYRAVLAGAAQT